MPAIITLLNPSRARRRRTAAKRRRGNPGSLMIINGRRAKRRSTMAVKRRRKTTRRVVATNPRRRRRTAAARPNQRRRRRTNRRRSTVLALNPRRRRVNRRRRRANPVRRRRSRVNPQLKGIIEGSVAAVAGMAITDFVQGMVPFSFGGALGKIAVRLGLAYAVGLAAERFGPTRKYATYLAIGGAVGAAQDAFRLFMGGGLTAAPAGAQQQLPNGRVALPAQFTGDDQGMSDIVGVPANWGGLGEIVGTSYPQGYFQ